MCIIFETINKTVEQPVPKFLQGMYVSRGESEGGPVTLL